MNRDCHHTHWKNDMNVLEPKCTKKKKRLNYVDMVNSHSLNWVLFITTVRVLSWDLSWKIQTIVHFHVGVNIYLCYWNFWLWTLFILSLLLVPLIIISTLKNQSVFNHSFHFIIIIFYSTIHYLFTIWFHSPIITDIENKLFHY